MGIRRVMAGALDLQRDVVLNLPVLHLTGDERLVVENHVSLREYDGRKIRVECSMGTVEIAGENLLVRTMNRDDILITGRIRSLTWQGGAVGP